jgi:PAS domain S-box-containing protein
MLDAETVPSGIRAEGRGDRKVSPIDYLKDVLRQTIDGVVMIDAQNNVVFFNEAAEKIWGYAPDEVLGSNVNRLVPPQMRSDHDGMVDRHRETGVDRIVGRSREVDIHRKDGSVRKASLALSSMTDGDGNRCYTAFVKDLSQETALKDSLGFIQGLLESIDGLTDQIGSVAQTTNLLSINASIEAARAGDAGRGFAVVAQEVRMLAGQAADVAERIDALVTDGRTRMRAIQKSEDQMARQTG